jgi:golgi to ER traffic protein 4
MPVSATSSARALGAILPLITSGQPYEAHQKARTFASRYSKSSQYDTAIDVLFQSARELFKTGQQGSGVDLSGFLLDVYESKGEVVSDESRGRCSFCWGSIETRADLDRDREIDAAHCSSWIIWIMAKDSH